MLDEGTCAELLAAPKLIIPAIWVPRRNGAGLEIGRKLECGFSGPHRLMQVAHLVIYFGMGQLERVSFHCQAKVQGRRETHQLYRLDLHQSGPHRNLARDDHPDSLRIFPPGSTHEHLGHLSIEPGRCDFASEPPQDCRDYDAAWLIVCDRLNITNGRALPPITQQGLLL